MTELVQRLRDWERIYPEDQDEPDHCLCLKAADRIEELEAKLAKAVEHFKKLRRRQDCLETFDLVVHEITETALAELTGGNDE